MHSARRCRVRTVTVGVGASIATLAAVSAFALADGGSSKAKPRQVTERVSCSLSLIAVKPPRTIYAENFGTVQCTPRLGKGVQHDSSFVTPTSKFAGSYTGPFQMFFQTGTLYGHFTISYVTNPTTLAVTHNGTLQIEGGTGKYKTYRGSGTLTGTSPDAIRTAVTEDITLTYSK